MLKALHADTEALIPEKFPGPILTKILVILYIFTLLDFKKLNKIELILSKFSLLFKYYLV